MKKICLSIGIIVLSLNIFTINTSAASTLNTNLEATSSIDQKWFQVVIKKSDSWTFPKTLWHSSGGYAGYLNFDTYILERDGFWYGTYNGFLLKGPFENSIKPDTEKSAQ